MPLRNSPSTEPGLLLAAVLAILIHVVFIVFLFFGLNWKTHPPEGMVVDLWHDLPQPVQPPAKIEPVRPSSAQPPTKVEPPKPEPVKQPPKAQPVVEPAQPKLEAPSPPKKPELALKEKADKPEPVKEQKISKQEQNKKELEQQKEKEKAEAQQREREQAQKQREQEAQAQREAQQAASRARVMDEIAKYRAMILAKIRSRIVMPPDLPGNPVTEFSVTLLPGGDILDVRLRRSSGYAAFDNAVERAIYISKPLPLPPDPALFREFRNLTITVYYHE